MKWFACTTLLISAWAAPGTARGQGGPLDDRVDRAIARGVESLRRQQSRAGHWDYSYATDHRLGITSLAGLALMENGVAPDDETIERVAAVVRELAEESNQAYDLSLAILFLARLDEGGDEALDRRIERHARRLAAGSMDGGWSYQVPIDLEESSTSRGRPGFFNAGPIDHSNTQFALLGVWAGGRHGFDSDATLGAIDTHFRGAVNRDGGWGYRQGNGTTPAMTCAGLMALAIAAARPSEAERLSARARGAALAADPVFQEALEVVASDARRIGAGSEVYYLWSLERVCVALGLRDLDGYDWYEAGAEELLGRQLQSGSWPNGNWGSLPETCLALLFLRKANLAFELDRVLKLPIASAALPGPLAEGDEPDPVVEAPRTGDDAVEVVVRQVDEAGFPEIALDFEVTGEDGAPILDASKDDFRLEEYDQPVEILRFEAPTSRESVATTVVLVVDRSRSMLEEDRIGALKQAVRTFLGVMPEGSRVAVVAFSDEIELICPFTTDRVEVQRAVDALRPDGGTRYYDAVVEALGLIADEPGRRAVLALTDGEDTFSQTADLDAAVLAARRSGLPVHTLGLGSEDEIASNDLRRLAAETRGQYFPARDAAQLAAIYEEIAARLGQMYRLVYRTDRPLPDGTLRPVSIYYRASTAVAGTAEVFIRGMVVPASGWPRLFLGLVAALVGLAILPGMLRRRRALGPGA